MAAALTVGVVGVVLVGLVVSGLALVPVAIVAAVDVAVVDVVDVVAVGDGDVAAALTVGVLVGFVNGVSAHKSSPLKIVFSTSFHLSTVPFSFQ